LGVRLEDGEGADLAAVRNYHWIFFLQVKLLMCKEKVSVRFAWWNISGIILACKDATHGNSRSHQRAWFIGMCQTPGRVFKGQKNGKVIFGNVKTTIQTLLFLLLIQKEI